MLNIVSMFQIFYPQSNVGFKASLALRHMTAFILQNSNLKWEDKESIICMEFIFRIGETFHIHTHNFVAFLESGNKNSDLLILCQL